MNQADALVMVIGGVAHVLVRTPRITVEVRDYDVDGCDDNKLWTDENGDRCVRYFVTHDINPPANPNGSADTVNTPMVGD
jgi:hypothetical protein